MSDVSPRGFLAVASPVRSTIFLEQSRLAEASLFASVSFDHFLVAGVHLIPLKRLLVRLANRPYPVDQQPRSMRVGFIRVDKVLDLLKWSVQMAPFVDVQIKYNIMEAFMKYAQIEN